MSGRVVGAGEGDDEAGVEGAGEGEEGVGVVVCGIDDSKGFTGSAVCLTSGIISFGCRDCTSLWHFEQRFDVNGLPKNPHPLAHMMGELAF